MGCAPGTAARKRRYNQQSDPETTSPRSEAPQYGMAGADGRAHGEEEEDEGMDLHAKKREVVSSPTTAWQSGTAPAAGVTPGGTSADGGSDAQEEAPQLAGNGVSSILPFSPSSPAARRPVSRGIVDGARPVSRGGGGTGRSRQPGAGAGQTGAGAPEGEKKADLWLQARLRDAEPVTPPATRRARAAACAAAVAGAAAACAETLPPPPVWRDVTGGGDEGEGAGGGAEELVETLAENESPKGGTAWDAANQLEQLEAEERKREVQRQQEKARAKKERQQQQKGKDSPSAKKGRQSNAQSADSEDGCLETGATGAAPVVVAGGPAVIGGMYAGDDESSSDEVDTEEAS